MESESGVFETKVRRNFLDFFRKKLRIDPLNIQYGNQSLRCAEISALRYGIIQMYINGIKANRMYEIGLKSQDEKKKIRIFFQSLRPFVTNKKTEEHYNLIIENLWMHIGSRLAKKAITDLENGKNYQIENLEITPKGVNIQNRDWLFRKRKFFIEWKDLRKYYADGKLYLYSDAVKKAKAGYALNKVWNSPIAGSVLDWVFKEGRAYSLASESRF
ncbi:MAG TPA: hypothetical protein PK453_24895 [Leptospiraceae bacterium]|nr:hypothetical protein [Leptospiraceae bacterium]HMY69274.1 hypothetical protein [Leptospiraceae bacterium]HNF16916.1 hypothetical protein [Leptospiraceae bacterium]HNF24296.1 hypothetical protein [Leptospiraceae bacterium]HNI95112.1 hypothetical protein [Leptospiraceae bacterium]